ncbi:MAG: hypothetical protein ACK470_20950 [Pseudanabaena sp.]
MNCPYGNMRLSRRFCVSPNSYKHHPQSAIPNSPQSDRLTKTPPPRNKF